MYKCAFLGDLKLSYYPIIVSDETVSKGELLLLYQDFSNKKAFHLCPKSCRSWYYYYDQCSLFFFV